ncbi:MAG: hypothetical protein LBG05_00560 [Treponema sp.]|jgi:hypothetical protein|nr:hypothetical protein [Treponema sp.]
MKKVFKAGIVLVLGIAMLISVAACAFPFQSPDEVVLQDISGTLNFTSISRQAFMGGSVLYNPDEPSSGQLAQGVHLAVRLGKVDLENGDTEQPSFSDREADARYGYITVDSINKESISFTYTEYAAEGNASHSSSFIVGLDERADINRDGLVDITYVKPVRKRPGLEQAVYLTFLSSQEELNTSMFAVLPEQYSRGVYPSGLMGIKNTPPQSGGVLKILP